MGHIAEIVWESRRSTASCLSVIFARGVVNIFGPTWIAHCRMSASLAIGANAPIGGPIPAIFEKVGERAAASPSLLAQTYKRGRDKRADDKAMPYGYLIRNLIREAKAGQEDRTGPDTRAAGH